MVCLGLGLDKARTGAIGPKVDMDAQVQIENASRGDEWIYRFGANPEA
jgi:hypothetical protein